MAQPCLSDSDTIHHAQDTTTGALVSDVILDPVASNLLSASGSGLKASINAASNPLVSTLPASPYDGQIVFFQSPDIGSPFMLRYDAAAVSAYKWAYIGGAPSYYKRVDPSDTRSSATYGTLTTPCDVQLPGSVQGDWIVTHGCRINGPGGGERTFQTVKLGVAAAADSESVAVTTDLEVVASSQPIMALGMPANAVLSLRYRSTSGGTSQYSYRWLRVTPVNLAAA